VLVDDPDLQGRVRGGFAETAIRPAIQSIPSGSRCPVETLPATALYTRIEFERTGCTMQARKLFLTTAAAALLANVAVVGSDAHAQGPGGGWGGGPGMMGPGMMGGRGGMHLFEVLDTDGDGKVGGEEAQAAMQERLEAHDTDGDGSLSLEEFQALHADLMRPMIVDHFQFFDDDGDGEVTSDEMGQPFARMMRWMDTDGDGALSPDDMRGMRGQRGMGGRGSMMGQDGMMGGGGMMGPGGMNRQP
jgi:Ca2+-binding EF-hand superfamily protein